jgi:hypothetical protein
MGTGHDISNANGAGWWGPGEKTKRKTEMSQLSSGGGGGGSGSGDDVGLGAAGARRILGAPLGGGGCGIARAVSGAR